MPTKRGPNEPRHNASPLPRPKSGQGFSPGALARREGHSDALKRDATSTGIAATGTGVQSFHPEPLTHATPRNQEHRPTEDRPAAIKPDLQSMIWELPLPKHHQHQDHPPPHPRRPHDQGMPPLPPPRSSPESQPDGPGHHPRPCTPTPTTNPRAQHSRAAGRKGTSFPVPWHT